MTRWCSGWPAPAKINRFLRILGRRRDGYHQLQTLFQFIEPIDRLDFAVTADPMVTREGGLPGLDPEEDLVVRAARALQRFAGVEQGVCIRLIKRIPAGGGLGGGSSDAATTLVALNELWGCRLPRSSLMKLALDLGADVPVFVAGRAAWAEGVGEELQPMAVDEPWLLMANPGVAVDTGAVFRAMKLTRPGTQLTIRDFEAGAVGNDCELVVRQLHPAVGEALDILGEQGPVALSGTGGCCFCRFDSRQAASEAAERVGDRVATWLSRASNRSPLLDRLSVVPS